MQLPPPGSFYFPDSDTQGGMGGGGAITYLPSQEGP